MSSIRSTSTKPEKELRLALWKRGVRYRINDKRLPGSPDIVFPKYHTVVFVHGCFWHGHKDCKLYVTPKTNTLFWVEKVARNQKRDQDVWRLLEAKGWFVVIVWECELDKQIVEDTIDRVANEIVSNGETFRRQKTERALNRLQIVKERKEQKARHKQLLSEIKQKNG